MANRKIFLTLDFETYYATKYDIKQLGISQFVAHPDFSMHSVAIKTLDAPRARAFGGPRAVANVMAKLRANQDRIVLCGHNLYFDAYIAYYHYNFIPAYMVDTLCMAQVLHAHDGPLDLDFIAQNHYGREGKVQGVLDYWKNLHWADATREQRLELLHYNARDVEETEGIAMEMIRQFPKMELDTIDLTLRMFTDPRLRVDKELAEEILAEEQEKKRKAVESVGARDKTQLRSIKQFAALLEERGYEVPEKWSEKQQKFIPALAKDDLPYQRMEKSDDPELRALIKARVTCNSSIVETRAEGLIARADRKLPIGLMYASAHTLRWGGTDKINPQNLPREGRLRHCLMADKGHVLVIVDASQIEARDNATFSEQWDLVEEFARGVDVYASFASELYGTEVTKETHPDERFVGKTCLGADTKILTQRGWIKITDVRLSDKLWDGVEWVNHQGVFCAGPKPIISLSGVELTPDHEILTGGTCWVPAQDVLTNAAVFQSALNSATLPSSAMSSTIASKESRGVGAQYAAAKDANQNTLIIQDHCVRADQQHATHAQAQSDTGNTKMLLKMMSTARGYLTVCLQRLAGAITKITKLTYTMVRVVSRYIVHGEKTEPCFCAMSKPLMGGIIQNSKWTESTLTGITNPETYGSAHGDLTYPTSEKSKTLKPVYDLLNAGKRKRFTILSNSGPLIVHNSILGLGFHMGAEKFQLTLETGMMGPPLKISLEEAQRAVNLYRRKYYMIKQHWAILSAMIPQMLDNGHEVEHRGVVFKPGGKVLMPNGLHLYYPGLTYKINPEFNTPDYEYWPYDKAYKTRVQKKLYGGLLLENLVQCRARCMTTEHMLKLSKFYRVVMMAHDEIVFHVPVSHADRCLSDALEVMSEPPRWNEMCPLAAEGKISDHYIKD